VTEDLDTVNWANVTQWDSQRIWLNFKKWLSRVLLYGQLHRGTNFKLPFSSVIPIEVSVPHQHIYSSYVMAPVWHASGSVFPKFCQRWLKELGNGRALLFIIMDHLSSKSSYKQNRYGCRREKTVKFLFVPMYMAEVARWLGQRSMPEWAARSIETA